MNNVTIFVEGEVDISKLPFTALNFFEGWQKLNGTATMKLITKIEDKDKIIANYGIMVIVCSEIQSYAMIERCNQIFTTYRAMIRAPDNTYTLILNGKTQMALYNGNASGYLPK